MLMFAHNISLMNTPCIINISMMCIFFVNRAFTRNLFSRTTVSRVVMIFCVEALSVYYHCNLSAFFGAEYCFFVFVIQRVCKA